MTPKMGACDLSVSSDRGKFAQGLSQQLLTTMSSKTKGKWRGGGRRARGSSTDNSATNTPCGRVCSPRGAGFFAWIISGRSQAFYDVGMKVTLILEEGNLRLRPTTSLRSDNWHCSQDRRSSQLNPEPAHLSINATAILIGKMIISWP